MGPVSTTGNAIATFKELCLDSHPAQGQDVTALGRFWAAATGCEYSVTGDPVGPADPGDVVGAEEGMGIAICPVPEPKTVKHRVHLDVSTDDVQTLVALGATVLREPDAGSTELGISWTVMTDPEGGEFCAFVRQPEKLTPYRAFELNVDSVDAEASARWWGEVFGVEAQNDGKPWWWIEGAPGFPSKTPWWGLVFSTVPEPKTVKNRWHWDVYGEVGEFLARGATKLAELPRWTVLADPEGNESVVLPARTRADGSVEVNTGWTTMQDPEGNEFCVFAG